MAADKPTREPPRAMGWYVVWHPNGESPPRPSVYFCVETKHGEVSCMAARPSEDEDFRPISHPHFAQCLWHGPFKTRRDATTAFA